MDKRFWAIIVVIILVVGGILLFSGKTPSTSSGGTPTNHVEGEGQDKVTLLEYGDYECPYCGQYYPIVKQVQALYDQQIFFQFRNLPLTQIHQNAYAGARAAEAAALQNKFWQMHDILYENQSAWVSEPNPEATFDQLASAIGLNITQFNTDYDSSQVNASIEADLNAFNQTGAQMATPSFFLDGKQINPTESIASFEQLINAELQKKGFTPPAGTTTSTSSSGSAPQSHQ